MADEVYAQKQKKSIHTTTAIRISTCFIYIQPISPLLYIIYMKRRNCSVCCSEKKAKHTAQRREVTAVKSQFR